MGLLDGYFDPQQFGEGGGLLGRLLALQQSQGLYQPGANFDQAPSAPPVALPQPTSWSILPNHGPTSSSSQAATPNPALQYQAFTADPLATARDARDRTSRRRKNAHRTGAGEPATGTPAMWFRSVMPSQLIPMHLRTQSGRDRNTRKARWRFAQPGFPDVSREWG